MLGVVLDSAVAQGDCVLARALLRAGAEIRANVLISAVRSNQQEIVTALLDQGAGIDDWGRSENGNPRDSALHIAVREGHLGMTSLLVQRGANKNLADAWGWTPLHEATSRGHVSVAEALMNAGADRHRRTEDDHLSAFDVASSSEVVRLMLELGEDVNAVGASGITALHCSRDKSVVDTLVEAGARIEARDAKGRTPLFGTTSFGRFGAAKALLDHGADVNAQAGDSQTPLMLAAFLARMEGALELVDSLLRSGADETMADSEGRTAAGSVGLFPTRTLSDIEENVERVRQLLANAPVDRARRRRGVLLLCVARHRRERRQSATIADVQENTDSQDTNGRRKVEGKAEDDWTRMATWVTALGLAQEGIFRTIVGYL